MSAFFECSPCCCKVVYTVRKKVNKIRIFKIGDVSNELSQPPRQDPFSTLKQRHSNVRVFYWRYIKIRNVMSTEIFYRNNNTKSDVNENKRVLFYFYSMVISTRLEINFTTFWMAFPFLCE